MRWRNGEDGGREREREGAREAFGEFDGRRGSVSCWCCWRMGYGVFTADECGRVRGPLGTASVGLSATPLQQMYLRSCLSRV